jgi:hypothetical protein
VVGKDPVELEKYLEKKVTKYYSRYVAVPFLRKITKI